MQEKKLKEEFKILTKLVDKKYYFDINFLYKKSIRFELDKKNIQSLQNEISGIKMRIFDGEKFNEYSTNNLNFENLKKQIKLLVEIVEKRKIKLKKELKIDKNILDKNYGEKDIEILDFKFITTEMKNLKEKILKKNKDILNIRIISSIDIEKNIFTNYYKNLYQNILLSKLIIVAYIKSKEGIKTIFESLVDTKFRKNLEKFDLNLFISKIDNYQKAKKIEGGKYKVILSPKLTGLLAHESFGHGMEGDTINRKRALSSKWLGKKIGPENLNIVDFPNMKGKHGFFYFDCDGNLARETYLVKNGILNEPLADIFSKTFLNLKNSSNSRMENFTNKNYTRMSNTFFKSGKKNLNDMIKKIEEGILIIDSSGGMEDPKSWGVQIQGNFGQKIKNGKLINEFYDEFTLTGFLPDIMKNISEISQDFEIEGSGFCGKGHKEWVRVSEGGPYITIDEVTLG